MNKVLFFLFILTSSIGFSNGLYFETIDKYDKLIIQTIDDKIYINPNRIFYENDTILLQTDDYRYLPIVYFGKDDIGYYTLKGEKTLDMIEDQNLKEELKKNLIAFNEEEYKKKSEITSIQEMVLYKSNASRYFDSYENYNILSKDLILCNETEGTISIKGSEKNGKKEAEGNVDITYKDTTQDGSEYEVSGNAGIKVDDEGNTETKVEVEAKWKF